MIRRLLLLVFELVLIAALPARAQTTFDQLAEEMGISIARYK